MSQTYKAILKDLKAKKYAPVYFLMSEEPYFTDLVTEYIESKILDEGERSFNQVVMYGKETHFKQVLDQARQFPMMASHRVVIVKEAQELSGLDKLEGYFSQPSPDTILVMAYKHKKLDKRKKVWKTIKANSVVLEAKKIYENKIPSHIISIGSEEGLQISPKVAQVIAENLGTQLSKIANELKKLSLNLEKGTAVTLDHVETYIGINKDYNVFELQKAIGTRNKEKAYRIAQYFAGNKKAHPIQMNVGALYSYFSKLLIAKQYERADNSTLAKHLGINPYIVGEYKSAVRNYDFSQLRNAIYLVHKMDKKSKGIDIKHSDDLGMYQEFLFGVFN